MVGATLDYLERRYAALEKELTDALLEGSTYDLKVADLQYRKAIIANEITEHRAIGRAVRSG